MNAGNGKKRKGENTMKAYNIRTKSEYMLYTVLLRDLLTRERSAELDDRIVELKKALRKYSSKTKGVYTYFGYTFRSALVHDRGDGYIEKITLPEEIETEAEAKEFVENMIWIDFTDSPYDCTGRPFSNWYKVFCRNGNWMAYHSVSYDV